MRTAIALALSKKGGQRQIGGAVLRKNNSRVSETDSKFVIELIDFLEENEFLSTLDSFLVQQGSCLMYLSDEYENALKGDAKKLTNILFGKDVETVFVKPSLFSKKSLAADALKLTGKSSHATTVMETERPFACAALSCLIATQQLVSDEDYVGTTDIRLGFLNSCMRLDSSAIDAVHLLPKSDQPSVFGSLFGVLNRCKTKMGPRLLERWLRQPLINVDAINHRLDAVEVFVESTVGRNQISDGPLKAIPDIESVVAKMQKCNAGLEEIFRIYTFARTLPALEAILRDLLDSFEETHPEKSYMVTAMRDKFSGRLAELVGRFKLYIDLIEHLLDMDKLPDLEVDPKHEPGLAELREERGEIEDNAERLLRQAREGWASFADIKLEKSSQYGLNFRTTRGDDERQLRANNKDIHILSILKNGVHFTTSQLQRWADRYLAIDVEYKALQASITAQAVETALTYVPLAETASALVAEIDVLVGMACAVAVAPNEYVRPTLRPMGSGIIRLKNARHPCVELMDGVSFIPNDYDLHSGVSNFQLITGPNMGGKSTYIRGIGSIVTLAQIGSFVPCEEAEISLVDAILARVGAGDAVQKGVSTFMAEMLEASVILKTATMNSLIIIDELGRGTSTFDGYGIAWALSQYISTELRCPCLFATHFHELTALEQEHPESGIVNKHVSALVEGQGREKKLVMLYNVRPGSCDESFGVHVAEIAHFPKRVIQSAKRKAEELEHQDRHDEFISDSKFSRVEKALESFVKTPVNMLTKQGLLEITGLVSTEC